MQSPITLSGSIPVTNPAGTTISAATAQVTNQYTVGAEFTFTNSGVLINTYDETGVFNNSFQSLDAGIYLLAGNSSSGLPVNRITNTGTIIGNYTNFAIDVHAHNGATNPVLITNTGTIRDTNAQDLSMGIYTADNVAATVINSGDIETSAGVQLIGVANGTMAVTNLAGGTIAGATGFNTAVVIDAGTGPTLSGTGIIVNYGDIGGYVHDNVLTSTIINGGTFGTDVVAYGSGTLVIDPGAVFLRNVGFSNYGPSNAPSTLLSTVILAGTGAGTLANPANYTGFGAMTVAAGADWTLGNTSTSAGISGVTTIHELGTLNVRGDIAGVTIAAGHDATIDFTGLNAGNSFSGAGSGPYVDATNPITRLAAGDTIILGPGLLNFDNLLTQFENDGTTFGQAYEFIENNGRALYVPYSGTAQETLTAQDLTFTTQGSEVTITIGETFNGPGPITLVGSTPTINAAGVTISAASPDVTNIYTLGAEFTFTNAGVLINTPGGSGTGIDLVAGNSTAGAPANLLTNTGSVSAYYYAIDVQAHAGQTNPVLIDNTGTIVATAPAGSGYGVGIFTGPNVAATVTNSGNITGVEGLALKGDFNGTLEAINLAGGTITGAAPSSNGYGVLIVQSSPGSLVGAGIVMNDGLISGAVDDDALNVTVVNGGTISGPVYGEGAGDLVLDPGADFGGGVVFSDQNAAGTVNGQPLSTIVLAGTGAGTLAHPGAYTGFGAITVAAGADWTLGNTSASAGVTGITTVTELGTLNVGGDIAGVTLHAGPDATIDFTGLNAGNSFSGAGSGPNVDATNPITGLTAGDTIILGPSVINTADLLTQGENDGTTFGQAYEFIDQSFGGIYVPYGGTTADPLTAQNLTFTTQGSEVTITVGEAYYTFTGTGGSTLAANYAGNAAPPATLSPDQVLIVTSDTDSIVSTTTLTNDSAITVTGGALLDTTSLAGTGTVTLENGGALTLANTLGTDAGQTIHFGAGGTSLALNTLELSGSAAGFGGTIANFGLNDAIILNGSVLPALGVGGQVSLGYAGSLLSVSEFNGAGTLTASTTLDVGTGQSASGFVALLGTSGVVLETPATVDEVPLTFTGTGTTASFEDPTDYAGGLAPGSTITAGETVRVTGAATLANTTAIRNDGTIIVSGTAASFTDPTGLSGSGTLVIENAGQVSLEAAHFSATNIAFGGNGTLTLGNQLSAAATISNFLPGDSIIFSGLTYAAGDSITTSGSIATVFDGAHSFSLNILPAGETFHLAAGTNGIVLTATPCFCSGTRIRTDKGEVPVEDLSIGDRVITLCGDAVPVKWLGRRAYRQPYPENSTDIIPILICRNALGPNLPQRDLYVSPLHAMYLADVLVPAGLLVNGRSIRACPELPAVQYIHIELDRHDVIFAEGAPSETFVDCDSRQMFENVAEFAELYPDDASPEWRFCAPRLESGPALRRIWQRLAGRAGLTASPEAAPNARLVGFIDHAEHTKITGWAYLPDHPDEAVELDVLDGEGLIARILADRHRADLAKAGIGNGRHGFELTFAQPLAVNRSHTIRVRRTDGAELARSPISLPAQKPRALPRALPRAKLPEARRALVLDALWPDPARDAGSNAILSHIAGLRALGFDVELMAVQDPHAPPARLLREHGVAVPPLASVEALLRARGGDYAVVYMHRLAVAGPYAGLVRNLSPALRVYSVADLHHRRLAGQARTEQDQALAAHAELVRAEEFLAMRQADVVITHSMDETAYLRAHCPGINAHTVPWHVPVARQVLPFKARQGVVFVGNYRHAPNQDAVRWLLAEIMPRVWETNPRITCRIAGAGWPESALPVLDKRVTLVGFVPEREALFAQARLSVAPLRFGAGLKGKVLDSLAAGIPCAMTTLAAEGFGLEAADSAAGLPAMICRLHEDAALNLDMGRAGQALAAERFGEAAVLDALRAALNAEASGTTTPARKKLLLPC